MMWKKVTHKNVVPESVVRTIQNFVPMKNSRKTDIEVDRDTHWHKEDGKTHYDIVKVRGNVNSWISVKFGQRKVTHAYLILANDFPVRIAKSLREAMK